MSDPAVALDLLPLLFTTGLLAGMVDAVAGGGGLITLPVLLAAGLAPTEALATNKLQGSAGTLSSSLYFVRHGQVQPGRIVLLIACTFAGSATGTLLVQHLSSGFLTRLIPLLLILIALYFWFGPPLREEESRQRLPLWAFALLIGFGVGFYDGFFGPGAGTFFAFGFVLLLGYDLVKATAHTKMLNLTSNLASLLFFAAGGQVLWGIGLTMAAGQFIGAHLGARLVLRRGARLIRPLIVLVSILISLKLLLQR
ncbi:MAG TPA: hypothetical protein ENI96_06860 [Sedimenticola thiotaurini]|uniref:Probable membrane transporter protein n=1 Tax=Sedimenticola thiotaurini TaxID=1543721 RepID=A0A831RMD7_9GAMM|nr:hypothetical protein [Sedimenticola thiotaurini]